MEGIILNIIPADAPSAIHEPACQQPLVVYPNPVSDVLYLKHLPCEQVEYSIYNMVGQEVATGASHGAISVEALGKGLYFLQIKGDQFHRTAKFVVK